MEKFFKHNRKLSKGFYPCIIVLLFGSFTFQLWFHATRTSATNDEPTHLLAGYRHWQCGDFAINPEHPPLLKLLAAFPLFSKDLIQPAWECGSKVTANAEGFQAGSIFLAKNNPDDLVIPARVAAMLMSLLLAVAVFLAAREMFGRWESVIALVLISFEPNIIAHGSLITTDMSLTATLFLTVYAFYRYQKKQTILRLLSLGLAVGLTLSSKHSGILILPILFSLSIADLLLFRKSGNDHRAGKLIFRSTASFIGVILMGFILLWALYGFRYYALPSRSENSLPLQNLLSNAPFEVANGAKVQIVKYINQMRIFPESYTFGLAYVVVTSPRPMYLFGKSYPTARWFYFPAAFSIKTSIPLLSLVLVGVLTLSLYRENPREMLFLLLPSTFFFVISLTSEMNIGIRHILPVYPFFAVVAANGVCYWGRKYQIIRYGLIVLLIYHLVTAFRVAPNYLSFSNDFWGGIANTNRLLDDSNVDWGQNFKLVKEYLAKENISDCWIAAFGPGELVNSYQPCRILPALDWDVTEKQVQPIPNVVEGTILISSWVLPDHGNPNYSPYITDEYSIFLQAKPVELIGGSIFVYRGRFEIPRIAALSYFSRAQQLIKANRFNEAILDLRKSIELSSDKPYTHLELGIALVNANHLGEASEELEKAIKLAGTNPELYRAVEERARLILRRLK